MSVLKNPASSNIDVNEIRNTVQLIGENLIEMREIGDLTPEIVQIKFEKIRKLTTKDLEYCLLVDTTQSNPPNGKVRMELQLQFKSCPKIKHVALFNGQNFIMNMIAQFVLGKLAMSSTTITKTKEQAMEKLKPYLK